MKNDLVIRSLMLRSNIRFGSLWPKWSIYRCLFVYVTTTGIQKRPRIPTQGRRRGGCIGIEMKMIERGSSTPSFAPTRGILSPSCFTYLMHAVPPGLATYFEQNQGDAREKEKERKRESEIKRRGRTGRPSQTSGRSRALGVTNYINADGTSSDCCVYRKIASLLLSLHPSFAVVRPARAISKGWNRYYARDAYGRRWEKEREREREWHWGRRRKRRRTKSEFNEKRKKGRGERGCWILPERRCEGGGIHVSLG